MARMPGATWRPIAGNYTPGGQVEVRGVVIHIMAGTLAGTDAWFRNQRAQASSHFGTGKKGALYQWVDTKDRAWAQGAGNRSWISVENEGKGGDELTPEQLDLNAHILAWAHKVHGVPLQVTNDPNGRGLGHHGMGGAAWGNHPACPGPQIVAQKAEIVRRAKLLVTPPSWREKFVEKAPVLRLGAKGSHVKTAHRLLDARGYPVGPGVDDMTFGDPMERRVRQFQAAKGLEADGVIGERTWIALSGF
jgi:hypothetical protein